MALYLGFAQVKRITLGHLRTISSISWTDTNAYSNQPDTKDYIEARVTQMCAANGQDAAGAEMAVIIGTMHDGGTDPQETWHACVKLKTRGGTYLKHSGPNGVRTKTLHMRLDPDQTTFNQNVLNYAKSKKLTPAPP